MNLQIHVLSVSRPYVRFFSTVVYLRKIQATPDRSWEDNGKLFSMFPILFYNRNISLSKEIKTLEDAQYRNLGRPSTIGNLHSFLTSSESASFFFKISKLTCKLLQFLKFFIYKLIKKFLTTNFSFDYSLSHPDSLSKTQIHFCCTVFLFFMRPILCCSQFNSLSRLLAFIFISLGTVFLPVIISC